jgi:hypothetical protein
MDVSMTTLDTADAPDVGGGDGVTVTVHLRAAPSTAAARRQQTVLERTRRLEAEGVVPDLTIERWSARVNVPVFDADGDDAGAVALFDEFETVAEAADVRLEPFFETREAVGGLLSSGPRTERILVFPVVCLTVRRGDGLTGLYPCWNGGAHERVEDALDALAAGEDVENL